MRVTAPTVLCFMRRHILGHIDLFLGVYTPVCMQSCSLVHLRPEEISGVLSLLYSLEIGSH